MINLWCLPTKEYYSAVKGKEWLIHTTWMNCTETMRSEKEISKGGMLRNSTSAVADVCYRASEYISSCWW